MKGNNILGAVNAGGQPWPKQKPKKRPRVTIIVGIECADSIVVASDSQTSGGSAATSKRMDGDKIHEVRFQDACGIIANSGSVTFGQRAVELTQEDCAKQSLTDYRQLAETAERSVRSLDKLLMEPYRDVNATVSGLDEIRGQNNFSLLTANFFQRKAHLFTLDYPGCVATRQKNYAAVGCGAGVAEFLISWFDFSKMAARDAAVTAAFIVGEVKKADFYCGGPTQVRILFPGAHKVFDLGPEAMNMIEAEVELGSRHYKEQWSASVVDLIGNISKKL